MNIQKQLFKYSVCQKEKVLKVIGSSSVIKSL